MHEVTFYFDGLTDPLISKVLDKLVIFSVKLRTE